MGCNQKGKSNKSIQEKLVFIRNALQQKENSKHHRSIRLIKSKKMNKLLYLFAAILLFTNYSCEVELFGCLRSEGAIVRQELSLPDISKIDLAVAGDIIITEGETQLIEIEAAQNVIDRIISDSDTGSDKWDIEINGCANIDNVKIYATLVDLESLDITGSGSIVTDGIFYNVDKIDLEIDGEGFMDIELATVEKVDIQINGAGDIKVSGNSTEQSIDINGQGVIDGFDLISQNCKIDISGSGDIEVLAEQNLRVDFDGSGSVCYKGTPTLNVDISGSGRVNNCN